MKRIGFVGQAGAWAWTAEVVSAQPASAIRAVRRRREEFRAMSCLQVNGHNVEIQH
jgi:hypothetical protein